MSERLMEATKVVLASSYKFTLLAQNYHWNVEGPYFGQLHELFGNIYEEVHGSIDKTAEEIRALGSYTPASLQRFAELSTVPDEIMLPDARTMLERLLAANEIVLKDIMSCYHLAEEEMCHGLSNFMAERQDAHKKHAWMLRSTLK